MDEQELKRILDDHEKRIKTLEGKKISGLNTPNIKDKKTWHRKGSTSEKILSLGDFFKQPKTIKEILDKLKEEDYHFKASDITLPLRKIVRNGSLKKTKTMDDGTKLKKWAYVRS